MKKSAGFMIIATLFSMLSTAMAAGLFAGYAGTNGGLICMRS